MKSNSNRRICLRRFRWSRKRKALPKKSKRRGKIPICLALAELSARKSELPLTICRGQKSNRLRAIPENALQHCSMVSLIRRKKSPKRSIPPLLSWTLSPGILTGPDLATRLWIPWRACVTGWTGQPSTAPRQAWPADWPTCLIRFFPVRAYGKKSGQRLETRLTLL